MSPTARASYDEEVTTLPTPDTVLLARPRGFCAGVDRAVVTVERALDLYGPPVYVRKEIVHNKHVVETLTERGVVFVEEYDSSGTSTASTPDSDATRNLATMFNKQRSIIAGAD